jgi:hypothetical protein
MRSLPHLARSAEHGDCCQVLRDRQSDQAAGRFVYVIDETDLESLIANGAKPRQDMDKARAFAEFLSN